MQLLTALREDAEHRTTQAEQTSELIRYSNVSAPFTHDQRFLTQPAT